MVKVRNVLALRKGADNCEGSELLDWFRSTFRVFFDRTHFFVYGSNFERVTWMLSRRHKVGIAMGRALHIDNEMLAELFGVSKQTIGRVDESAERAIDPIGPCLSILSTAYKCQLQMMAKNLGEAMRQRDISDELTKELGRARAQVDQHRWGLESAVRTDTRTEG